MHNGAPHALLVERRHRLPRKEEASELELAQEQLEGVMGPYSDSARSLGPLNPLRPLLGCSSR